MGQVRAPEFGTSGLRGLVVAMTPELIAAHVQAFLRACDAGTALYVGQDLRPSSPRIAADVRAAARDMGCDVVDCGAVPTPALALAAGAAGASAVMVTGSHIPADRNGLKFYTPQGEITKADEAAILAALGDESPGKSIEKGLSGNDLEVNARYAARYVRAYGKDALKGRRIGLYSHSAVGRDVLGDILRGLGADVIELGRSAEFIPVDTEAVDPDTRAAITAWVRAHSLDALLSTDGDSDRPLLADEKGTIVPGDIMGQIAAEALGADVVVTPVSSNSGVTHKGFEQVTLTRIGSPFVIAGMEAARGAVVGYEANGGFLLGFEAQGPTGPLAPLLTRDCTLPMIAVLQAAGPGGLAARVAAEPPVITCADRLQEIPQARSGPLLAHLTEDADARADFLAALGGQEAAHDLTDGLRMTLRNGSILHLRPSGNAPELRIYVESTNAAAAAELLRNAVDLLRKRLG